MQLGVPSAVDIIIQYGRTLHSYSPASNQSFLNVTTVDVADVKNRVQVRSDVVKPERRGLDQTCRLGARVQLRLRARVRVRLGFRPRMGQGHG